MINDIILNFITTHYGETATFVFVAICVLLEKLEKVPSKYSPFSMFFGWIGGMLNKDTNDKLSEMDQRFGQLESDFSDHKVESWRRDILNFADSLMRGDKKTKENFSYIIKIHGKYDKYIEEHNLENGQVDLAYDFISKRYQYCVEHNCFL